MQLNASVSWNANWSETVGSTTCKHLLRERMKLLRRGNLIQVLQNFAVIFLNGKITQIALDQGFVAMETCIGEQHHVRHPTLPIIFEYPLTMNRTNWGGFYFTHEGSYEEEAQFKDNFNIVPHDLPYNEGVIKQTVRSGCKKRLLCYEESEDESKNVV